MVVPKKGQLPCPNMPPFPPWAAEVAPVWQPLSEGTAVGLFPPHVWGSLQRAQFRALTWGWDFLQTGKSRPSLSCAIIDFITFMAHIWVQVKYSPASLAGGHVHCAVLVEEKHAFVGHRSQ